VAQHDEHFGPTSLLDQRFGQPALPHTGLASDQDRGRLTGAGRGEARVEQLQLALPGDQRARRLH
jgi:hypothetical protein